MKPSANLLSLCLSFIFISLCQIAQAQMCDKKTMVFFESDQYSISAAEEEKLQNLVSQFTQKSDTFLLEVYAFTDSIASQQYNYKLAQNRFKSIVSYLKKNSSAYFRIVEKVKGEAEPLSSNNTEQGRAKNRRVEIFYFKMNGGRVTLRGKGGMEAELGLDFFGSCGVCGCNTSMTEIFTNQQAVLAGVSLTTTEGCALITGGMLSINFGGQDPTKCVDAKVSIPASQFDEDMEIWSASFLGTASSWSRDSTGALAFDEIKKVYTLIVKICPGAGINVDKINRALGSPNCRASAAAVAVPELDRPKRFGGIRVANASVVTKEGVKWAPMARLAYNGRGRVFFVDSGISKEKIGYYFTGFLDSYVRECDSARCRRLNECWCYEIPLSDYKKIIYFDKKKEYILKIPRKYKNYAVKLFIPAADSIITIANLKSSKRKYKFKSPVPATYVVLYKENAAANNKRAYDYQVDLEKVSKKYSKRKKAYKAKIKVRQLKHKV